MESRPKFRLCVDRVVRMSRKIEAADLAIGENIENEPSPIALQPGASLHRAKMAVLTGKRWQNARELTVRFLDGSTTQKKKTHEHANVWSQLANVRFRFINKGTANIRISFVADTGSWSAVGTDCLVRSEFPVKEPTMNFGWLRDDTDDVEYRRVVLHEFGHALGAIHEHQNPEGGIEWNLPAVYAYFSGPPNNWSKDEIDFNVVQKYSVDQLNATTFDPESIMLYEFPAKLLKSGTPTRNNTDLSDQDKRFIASLYPKSKESLSSVRKMGIAGNLVAPTKNAAR